MDRLRVITTITGKEIKGMDYEFIPIHNDNHGSSIIIFRQDGLEIIIHPEYIVTDAYYDVETKSIAEKVTRNIPKPKKKEQKKRGRPKKKQKTKNK